MPKRKQIMEEFIELNKPLGPNLQNFVDTWCQGYYDGLKDAREGWLKRLFSRKPREAPDTEMEDEDNSTYVYVVTATDSDGKVKAQGVYTDSKDAKKTEEYFKENYGFAYVCVAHRLVYTSPESALDELTRLSQEMGGYEELDNRGESNGKT